MPNHGQRCCGHFTGQSNISVRTGLLTLDDHLSPSSVTDRNSNEESEYRCQVVGSLIITDDHDKDMKLLGGKPMDKDVNNVLDGGR